MQPIPIDIAANVLRAYVVGRLGGPVCGVCTDTRQNPTNALFFALKGENADGHQYVRQAFELGAAGAVVERVMEGAGSPQLVVPDTLRALGDLACYYRDRFLIPVVAVTGSVGKTSTKEMIACALRARYNVLVSEKNFNNEIGLPQTLFRLEQSHQMAVVEMGMRGVGQIARLAEIAHPTIGVITNIGLSHIELLGSREAIAAAKAELPASLPPDGLAIIPADDDFAAFLRARCRCRVVTFGVQKTADYQATDIVFSERAEPRFRVRDQEIALHTPGIHQIHNALAACAVAGEFGIPLSDVADALGEYQTPAMRLHVREAPGGITLLDDTYNAAPDSMRSALLTLTHIANAQRRRAVAILGDMRELGDHSLPAHRYVGDLTAQQRPALLITVGAAAEEIARQAAQRMLEEQILSFPDTDAAVCAIRSHLLPNDIVLVKGSRAMQMEKIVSAIMEPTDGFV